MKGTICFIDCYKLYFKGSRVVIDAKLKKYTFFETFFILGGKGTRMVNYNFVPLGSGHVYD